MSLHNEAIERMRGAARASGYDLVGPPADAMFSSIADECLRQMEWARTECSPYAHECWHEVPLTLAPPDWKP
jgi:hypothetical protein